MDRAKFPYHSDTEGFIRSLGQEGELAFISDHSPDEPYGLKTSSIENDYYLVEDFTSFKDVARSKKFYLKKKAFNEPKLNELEDVFIKKSADDEGDSEEEKILQVVWSDDDPVQNKLVRFVEALDMKKSNSKFTLSMLDEERISADIDSIEGEEIKGRFLEVKDSLEVLATSSRNLHGSRYSDWDFTVDEDPEVNRIWRKSDSQWASSLQIEIGKLPSQADQETVLQVLDDGAQGKISVRDITECLSNLLETATLDKDYPSKKVSFCAVPSKSCLSKESLSQTSTQSGRSCSHKKVSFYTDTFDDNFDDFMDKGNKKVSFYELACDDDMELLSQSENGKIKKSVSFHDSVDFEKAEKNKESGGFFNEILLTEVNTLKTSTDKSSFNEQVCDFYKQYDESNYSGQEKSLVSNTAASGGSMAESFSSFSTRTSYNGSIVVSELQDLSDFSLPKHEDRDRVTQVHLMKFLNDQIIPLSSDENDINCKFGDYTDTSKQVKDSFYRTNDDSINKILADVKNEIKSVIKDLGLDGQGETTDDKLKFVRNLIEESLNKKFEENEDLRNAINEDLFVEQKDSISSGIGKTIKLLYDQYKDIVDIDNLSKSVGLAMAFENSNVHYVPVGSSDLTSEKDKCNLQSLYSLHGSNNNGPVKENLLFIDPSNHSEAVQFDESYMSADSDCDLQVNRVTTSDLSLSYTLNKYIYTDYPPFIDDDALWFKGELGFTDQVI